MAKKMQPKSNPSSKEEVSEEPEVNEEVDNEEGEKYMGGPIPKVSLPEQND